MPVAGLQMDNYAKVAMGNVYLDQARKRVKKHAGARHPKVSV